MKWGRHFYSIAPSIITAALALLSMRVYSALLTPNAFGTLMLWIGGLALLDAAFSMSASQTTYFLAKDDLNARRIAHVVWGFRRYALSGTALAIIPMLVIWAVVNSISGTSKTVGLIIWMAPTYLLIDVMRAILVAIIHLQFDRKYYAAILIADSVCTLTLAAAALTINSQPESYMGGVILAKTIILLFAFNIVKKKYYIEFVDGNIKNSICSVKNKIRHLSALSAMGLLGWASGFLDRYVVALTIGPTAAGHYAIASGIVGRPFNIITASLTSHFRPDVYKFTIAKDELQLKKLVKYWIGVALGIGAVGTIILFLLNEQIVSILLASEFRSSVGAILPIMGMVFTVAIMTHCVDNIYLAKGKNAHLLYIQMICLIVTVVLIVGGGVYFGVIGTIFGRLIAETVKLVVVSFGAYFSKK